MTSNFDFDFVKLPDIAMSGNASVFQPDWTACLITGQSGSLPVLLLFIDAVIAEMIGVVIK